MNSIIKCKVLVCAVRRNEEAVIPAGNFTLQAEDIVSLTGADRDIELFLRAIGAFKKRIKHMMVVGGGTITEVL